MHQNALSIIALVNKPKDIARYYTVFVMNGFRIHTKGRELIENVKVVVLWNYKNHRVLWWVSHEPAIMEKDHFDVLEEI